MAAAVGVDSLVIAPRVIANGDHRTGHGMLPGIGHGPLDYGSFGSHGKQQTESARQGHPPEIRRHWSTPTATVSAVPWRSSVGRPLRFVVRAGCNAQPARGD